MLQHCESLVNFFYLYPNVGKAVLIAAGLRIYYHLSVVRKVELDCKQGSKFQKFLVDRLPILKEDFKPTFWCFESRMQTLFASIFRRSLPNINYTREVVKLRDGGEICIDWLDTSSDDPNHPTILFLPGLTGDSQSEYIKTFVNVARQTVDARCGVLIYRGLAGNDLKTARAYCGADPTDVSQAIDHIKQKYPQSPLTALGVSLGGIILGNYLKKVGEDVKGKLVAVFLVSVCWDAIKGRKSLEQWGLNRMLNKHLAKNLVDHYKKNMKAFDFGPNIKPDSVMSSELVSEFDDSFTAPHFGYKDVDDYYKDLALVGNIHCMQVPVLAVSAEDDPFQPGECIPSEEAKMSENVAILRTKYGGHIGFMEGWLPTTYHFTDRLFAQFLSAVYRRDGVKILDNL